MTHGSKLVGAQTPVTAAATAVSALPELDPPRLAVPARGSGPSRTCRCGRDRSHVRRHRRRLPTS